MSTFGWISKIENLTPAALTVLAQTRSPNDNGRLVWDAFMPRANTDSIRLEDVTTLDFRPASGRRAWNQRGRRMPLRTPDGRKLEIEPIEFNFRVDEKEMQLLMERFLGNAQLIQQVIGTSIPDRVEALADANYRQLELDVLESWATGKVTVKDPETGETYEVDFGFAAARLETAGTAWDDAGVNAYDEFIAWAEDAITKVGPIKGAALRLATRKAILADAPALAGGVKMSVANLEDRISQDLNVPFSFYLMEDTVDIPTDGGVTYARGNKWPVGAVAAVPSDGRIGKTAFAPIGRAMSIDREVPEARVDIRGNAVFHFEENGGRELDVECQLNAFPIPDENRIAVIDSGIS
jgi:hypothetical protein